ncbi:hypothetical protein [Streptomyces sp. ISL-10]|uniref:hypothetical protein n=1 Tax=Streptomyces sp. ISL-10 TaxID=2819172 RepID=UPI0020352663|nr:hypothetical protein [Streptomyces sp. ISL-10]
MRLTIDGDWNATVTGDPLSLLPSFDFRDFHVRIAEYANVEERGRFLLDTFGSEPWLWDAPDELRFDKRSLELVGAEFQLPSSVADAEDSARVPAAPLVHPGGLRADEVRDFRLEVTTELCRAAGDTVLTCLRDLDVLDEPLDARIGIAPDVALLVQHGTVVGWSLTDPARYLTTGFAAPAPAPPAPATRHLLTKCLDLVTTPLLDEVRDRDPAALAISGRSTTNCGTSARTATEPTPCSPSSPTWSRTTRTGRPNRIREPPAWPAHRRPPLRQGYMTPRRQTSRRRAQRGASIERSLVHVTSHATCQTGPPRSPPGRRISIHVPEYSSLR